MDSFDNKDFFGSRAGSGEAQNISLTPIERFGESPDNLPQSYIDRFKPKTPQNVENSVKNNENSEKNAENTIKNDAYDDFSPKKRTLGGAIKVFKNESGNDVPLRSTEKKERSERLSGLISGFEDDGEDDANTTDFSEKHLFSRFIHDGDDSAPKRKFFEITSKTDSAQSAAFFMKELQNGKKKLLGIFICFVISLIFAVICDVKKSPVFENALIYPLISLVISVAGMCFAMGEIIVPGLKSLFGKEKSTDSAVAILWIITLLQNIFAFAAAADIGTKFRIMAAPALLATTVCYLGKILVLRKTAVSSRAFLVEEQVCGIDYLTSEGKVKAASGQTLGEGKSIGYFSKIKLPSDFVNISLSDDTLCKVSRLTLTAALAAGVLVGIVAWVLNKSFMAGFTAFTALAGLSVPVSAFLMLASAMLTESEELRKKSAGIADYAAARRFCRSDAVVLDATDVFDGSCELVKAVSAKGFDGKQSAVYATALLNRCGAPLAKNFKSLIGATALPAVSEFRYEDGMGYTGLIGASFVCLGTRQMLQNHNTQTGFLPPDLEKELESRGEFILYLSINQNIAAYFNVKYSSPAEFSSAVNSVISRGISVLFRSLDPYLTAERIEKLLSLPGGSVKIMQGPARDVIAREHPDRYVSLRAELFAADNVRSVLSVLTSAIKMSDLSDFARSFAVISSAAAVIIGAVLFGVGGGISASPLTVIIIRAVIFALSAVLFRSAQSTKKG